MNYFSGYNLPR